MISVNGKNIEIYELDTPTTISARIATKLKTLPKYLAYPNTFLESIVPDSKIEVIDVLKLIKDDAKISTDFESFLKQIKPMISPSIDETKDILYPWLSMNKNIENKNSDKFKSLKNFLIEKKYFSSERDFENVLGDREKILKALESSINLEKNIVDSRTKIYKEFDDIQDSDWINTDFQTERVKLNITLDIEDISLMELFNSIILNKGVPFASINQYYKILKNYIPSEDWIFNEEDIILLKVCSSLSINPELHSEYIDVRIFYDNENIQMSTELNISKNKLNQELFIERILSVFNNKIKIKNIEENEIAGVFYYPQQLIDSYVFSDLVMSNFMFSFLINIDESTKATKKKTESGQPWIYIHFENPLTGHITASITQKFAQKGDKIIKQFEGGVFKVGMEYVRIKITKAKNISDVNNFIKIFGKLLFLYDENYNDIVEIYKKYIKDFGVVEKPEIEDIDFSKPQNVAPEIFVNNYSSMCQSNRIPTVILEEKVPEYEKNGYQVMKYPRDKPDKGQVYESDGVDQRYYVCLNPSYKFPGVQKNTKLSNANEYPYVPCCFAVDQTNRKLYEEYYKGEIIKDKIKKQQDFITTNKILSINIFGKLPDKIERIFNMIDPDTTYEYIRLGVNRSKSSFLEVAMLGMYETSNIFDYNDEDRMNFIEQTRKKLSSLEWASICRQSAYDTDIENVQKNILDPNVYLDPKLYVQMVETYLKCNIFIFNREVLISPYYIQGYYRYKNDWPSIFIYEHYGGRSDNATYPQCELIIKWNTKSKNDTIYNFDHKTIISKRMLNIFNILNKSYALDKPITSIDFNLKLEYISQIIDSYGKCRQINLLYKNQKMTIFTSPLPPVKAPEIKNHEMYKIPVKYALNFINEFNATNVRQHENKNVICEISCVLRDIEIIIPIENSENIEGIPIDSQISYSNQESAFQQYNYNKKMARYIVEYSYWLFSKFLRKKNTEIITDSLLNEFSEKIQIIPNFKYKNVRKKFSTKGGIMKKKKLVVTSEEMKKRIMYVLRLYSLRNTKSLVNYYTKNVIQYYYMDITDFDRHSNQVILYGEESIEKWIQESNRQLMLNNKVTIGSNIPYFFKNNLVSDQIFLAQNLVSLEQAFDISITWINKGYNKSVYAVSSVKKKASIYNYISHNNITLLKGTGNELIRILAYKVDNTPFYTVLLSLKGV